MRTVRIGLIIAMWLTFGAAVAVGTTWLGIISTFGWGWQPTAGPGPQGMLVDAGLTLRWPHTPPSGWNYVATNRWEISSLWSDHLTYLSETGWMYDHRAGLPLRCLGCWETEVLQADQSDRFRTHGSFPVRLEIPQRQFLPYQPLWIGFAINSILFAAVARCLGHGFWTIYLRSLHRRRHRAGRCPSCNYNCEGLPPGAVCPECGASRA